MGNTEANTDSVNVVLFPYKGKLTVKQFALDALDLMTGLKDWIEGIDPQDVFDEHFGGT